MEATKVVATTAAAMATTIPLPVVDAAVAKQHLDDLALVVLVCDMVLLYVYNVLSPIRTIFFCWEMMKLLNHSSTSCSSLLRKRQDRNGGDEVFILYRHCRHVVLLPPKAEKCRVNLERSQMRLMPFLSSQDKDMVQDDVVDTYACGMAFFLLREVQ